MYLMNQTDHHYWMNIALEEARIAALQDEVPVGAVLVKDNQEIARGHNMPIQSNDPSAHAEIVVLRKAGLQLSNYRLPNTSLYVTLEPCLMCAGAIMNSRIAKVFYGANDPKTGVATSILNVFDNMQLNHHCQIEGGILDHECGDVLKDFFKNKRLTQE
jgi:tRNA(adenine34) deaminase